PLMYVVTDDMQTSILCLPKTLLGRGQVKPEGFHPDQIPLLKSHYVKTNQDLLSSKSDRATKTER
ncbi:hypothetical protein, partial [Vibrio cholerae]|uniref:hypothetical protein n=1 Tax=Vibrio cholerae TaxID=666 RepID=UPI001C1183EA